MHCVQACLKTMLRYFDMPVPSFEKLDEITGHEPDRFTWMSKALLWIASNKLRVSHVENLDYALFAKRGTRYLERIWDKNTFKVQNKFSDLKAEQRDAAKLLANKNITLINDRLNVREIKLLFDIGFFIMLSVNPNVLKGGRKYDAHLIVVAGFKDGKVRICDPDNGFRWYKESILDRAISSKYRPDFSATLVTR